MRYTAAKPMPIGDRFVQAGEAVPEVASFPPHVIRRLVDTRWVFADDTDACDLTYTAGLPMRIGTRAVTQGQPCPEVAAFSPRVLARLIDNRFVLVTRTARKENAHGKPADARHDSRARFPA